MLRATIAAAVLLGAAPALADGAPACPDKQYVIDYMTAKYPGVTVELLDGRQGLAIKSAIKGADATEFLVFAKPGSGDRRLIVGFENGCLEDAAPVTIQTIRQWLAGQESGL